jgi:Holliday junction resolvase
MLQGTSNPFEAFVSQWLSMKGYLVQNPVNYRFSYSSAQKLSWSDIDVVGTKKGEVLIVECKEWLSKSQKATINEIEQKFRRAENFLNSIGITRGKTVKFMFAQIDKNPRFGKLLDNLGKRIGKTIEYVDFGEMVNEFCKAIQPYIDDTHMGKFGEPFSWLLSRLIYYDYIKPKTNITK